MLCYILRAIRAGRCRERRYADHIIYSDKLQSAPFRSQIFKIFFASGSNGALTPLTKILRTFLRTLNRVQRWCELRRWLKIACLLAAPTADCASGRWKAWDWLRPNSPSPTRRQLLQLMMPKMLLGNKATPPNSRRQQTSSHAIWRVHFQRGFTDTLILVKSCGKFRMWSAFLK